MGELVLLYSKSTAGAVSLAKIACFAVQQNHRMRIWFSEIS
jgi:hypothetical protein